MKANREIEEEIHLPFVIGDFPFFIAGGDFDSTLPIRSLMISGRFLGNDKWKILNDRWKMRFLLDFAIY